MTTSRTIVQPADIEKELLRIWEDLSKVNKTRACLFNLIVYSKLNKRHDYIRMRVQKIIDKFPCRILFITSDPDPSKDYLKTAVSVALQDEDNQIACDNIDIGVGKKSEKQVPFIILSHIITDLPIYLLWTEDICHTPPLFESLAKLSARVIFDSESSDHLYAFAKTLLHVRTETRKEIADLNWARTEPWRDLLASQFYPEERQKKLKKVTNIKIVYNSQETEFFSHLRIQAFYLYAWLSSRLHFRLKKIALKKGRILITCESQTKKKIFFEILPDPIKHVTAGAILSIALETEEQEQFTYIRDIDVPHQAAIKLATKEKCELPFHFMLGKDVSGLTLTKEITSHGTSAHFVNALKILSQLKNPKIC